MRQKCYEKKIKKCNTKIKDYKAKIKMLNCH